MGRCKCLKDGQEGWITVKGNAGTKFAQISEKHYCVVREAPLTKAHASSSEIVRQLVRDEALEALDKPREELFTPGVRIKVRAASDRSVGWIDLNVKSGNVKPWTPNYKCKTKTPIHNTLAIEGATVLRELEAGESLEFFEGPKLVGKELRIKARAEKDGVVGWVTVKDSEGNIVLTS